jgi:hypothetical protein
MGPWVLSEDAPNAVIATETTAEYAQFAEPVLTKCAYTARLA